MNTDEYHRIPEEPDDSCATCGEFPDGSDPYGVCPKSRRACGHHCNCSWENDCCHWCGGSSEECPECYGEGVVFSGDDDDIGDGCEVCGGEGWLWGQPS